MFTKSERQGQEGNDVTINENGKHGMEEQSEMEFKKDVGSRKFCARLMLQR